MPSSSSLAAGLTANGAEVLFHKLSPTNSLELNLAKAFQIILHFFVYMLASSI